MKKLKIVEVDRDDYYMKDMDGKGVVLNLNFMNVDVIPKRDNYIFISEKLLDKNYKEYSSMYNFGPIGGIYGRKIENEDDADILIVEANGQKFYLQRYYG